MSNTTTATATTGATKTQLLDKYNSLATKVGAKELKNWKGSTQGLVDRLAAVEKAIAAEKVGRKVKSKAKGAKAPKGPTIASTAYAALDAGKSPKEALAIVLEKHPGARTTIGCIRWYKAHSADRSASQA